MREATKITIKTKERGKMPALLHMYPNNGKRAVVRIVLWKLLGDYVLNDLGLQLGKRVKF